MDGRALERFTQNNAVIMAVLPLVIGSG